MARRARHDLPAVQDKRSRVVQLRSEGWTWDRIAAETGYANGSAASKAWRAAIQQRPDQTVDEVRTQERTRLEAMDSRLSDIISRPPVRTTSIGRTQWDVRTCSCPVKARTDHEHDPDCTVEPVLDETAVIAAIKERRQIGESLRRLTGADATPAIPALSEQFITQYARACAERDQMNHQAPTPLTALPGNYHELTPEQQYQADIDRRRDQVDAQRAAITAALTPQPGDDQVTEAEIVDP